MFKLLSLLATVSIASAAQYPLVVSSPGSSTSIAPTQCETYDVFWHGGASPYTLNLVDVNGNFVEELGTGINYIEFYPFEWYVAQPAGKQFQFSVTDAEGTVALGTGVFTVQDSRFTSCLSP